MALTAKEIQVLRARARKLRDQAVPRDNAGGKVVSYLTAARAAFNMAEYMMFHAEIEQRRVEKGGDRETSRVY